MTSGSSPATNGTETRFTLQESSSRRSPTSSTTTAATRPGNRRGGSTEEAGALDLQQPHRAPGDDRNTNDGDFLVPPHIGGRNPPTPVPLGRTFKYDSQNRHFARARPPTSDRTCSQRQAGRFISHFRSGNAAAPVGGCRMATPAPRRGRYQQSGSVSGLSAWTRRRSHVSRVNRL